MTNSDSNDWQTRRSAILKPACNFIADRLQNGARIGRAIKAATRRFRSRSLGGGRRIRLSEKTMTRIWYAWKALRDDSVFLLRYRAGHPRVNIDPRFLRSITEISIAEGRSLAHVLRSPKLKAPNVSQRTIYRRLPVRSIGRLARLQRRALRQEALIEREKAALVASLPK